MQALERGFWVVCLLSCGSSLWGCSSPEHAPGENEPSAPAPVSPSSPATSPSQTLAPMGTQTGGEGEQPVCAEATPNWVPVEESLPFPTHYSGSIRLEGGASAPAELTLSNVGAVYALALDPGDPVSGPCLGGRQGEVDWQLSVDGVLHAGKADRVVYSLGYRGSLRDTFELADVEMQLLPPTAEDFRAANGPAPWSPGDGPVRVDVALQLGDATAELELRWSCWTCGASRVALPLGAGTLVTSAGGGETRPPLPEY